MDRATTSTAEARPHAPHEGHHEMPTSGRALTTVALSATLHCLTGCAIGEVAGMAIGTAVGLSNGATVVLSIALAFFFGYSLTSLPLLRAGLALGAVVPIAFASDTLSIAVMEAVDNAIMVGVPGAMDAGLSSVLFWGSLAFALAVAGAFALPVNRWLIARGKGHAVVHETGIHGGPPVRVVGTVAVIAFLFGSVVLIAEALGGNGGGHGGHDATQRAAPVRGLAVTQDGLTLSLARGEFVPRRPADLTFRVLGPDGRPVRDFAVEHTKRMHLIVVRRDMTGFQHLHPRLGSNGVWRTRLTLPQPGSYRVFADFKRGDSNITLAGEVAADGDVDWKALPASSSVARSSGGYEVHVNGTRSRAGHEEELRFTVNRGGRPVRVEPYLGARGHLVALRQGDLAYLHVHPTGSADGDHGPEHGGGSTGDDVAFMTTFPTEARYRLFLQFKVGGKVHTAAFTRAVDR